MDLLAAVRRPLVVLDYETTGLGPADRPVEAAWLVFAPWAPPETDETTRTARHLLRGKYWKVETAPGQSSDCHQAVADSLTACVHTRLDPQMPIPWEATQVHRIGDADVRGCPAWNDVEVCAYVRSLADGTGTAMARGADGAVVPPDWAGPAVFCGHNIASFDMPRAAAWGHLNASTAIGALVCQDDVIDTDRLVRRLKAEHPAPLAPDALPWGDPARPWPPLPVVGDTLRPYATAMDGCRLALLGERPDDTTHGALVDACLAARVLHACLELWSPLWPRHEGKPPEEALAALLAALGAPPLDCRTGVADLAWDGWLALSHAREHQGIHHTHRLAVPPVGGDLAQRARVRCGKHAGKTLAQAVREDRSYFERWLLGLPHAPNTTGDQWCAPATREAIEAALGGKVMRS